MKKTTRLHILSIFVPNEVAPLRTPGMPLEASTITASTTQRFIDDMHRTMKQAAGIGLAAPQVGRSLRLAVIDRLVDDGLQENLTLINPMIVHPSTDQALIEEGCLSIPGVFGIVQRARHITVRYYDRDGCLQSLLTGGLLARVIQHEVDHLNGILFIDRHPDIVRGQDLLPSR